VDVALLCNTLQVAQKICEKYSKCEFKKSFV